MKIASEKIVFLLLALLIAPAAGIAQDQRPERGIVELGSRWSWGDVYGRPDLPFQPTLKTSKYDEYRDLRDGVFVRRFRLNMDDLGSSKYFLDAQSDKSIYRDQSYLVTFGRWNRFKMQFRYDEIPHIFSNTHPYPICRNRTGSFHHSLADPDHPAKSCLHGSRLPCRARSKRNSCRA